MFRGPQGVDIFKGPIHDPEQLGHMVVVFGVVLAGFFLAGARQFSGTWEGQQTPC